MNKFLTWATSPEAEETYTNMNQLTYDWVQETNGVLKEQDLPVQLACYTTVWTMLFTKPGRYHWMLQYYLKDEGIALSWVGTGRLNFSLDFTKEDMDDVRERLIRACRRMEEDGWWYHDESTG